MAIASQTPPNETLVECLRSFCFKIYELEGGITSNIYPLST